MPTTPCDNCDQLRAELMEAIADRDRHRAAHEYEVRACARLIERTERLVRESLAGQVRDVLAAGGDPAAVVEKIRALVDP